MSLRKTLPYVGLGALAAAAGALLLAPDGAMADRTDVWLASTVVVNRVAVHQLKDGGCQAEACGTYRKQDGGIIMPPKCTEPVDLTGTALTRCLNVLNSADALFKQAEGL